MEKKPIGVIGGSGLYNLEGLEVIESVKVNTPWGEPSDEYVQTRYGDRIIYFLPRHGRNHDIPPHRVNYRANIWGFRKLGVERIIGVSAVGGITKKPGDIVIPDNFLDFSKQRPLTFYEGKYTVRSEEFDVPAEEQDRVLLALFHGKVVHIDVSIPFCPQTRDILIRAARDVYVDVYPHGTYALMEGPRLETPAEIQFLKTIGADVVGMTMTTEAVLARELELCYAGINVVTNWAAGISEHKLTTEEVVATMRENTDRVKKILVRAFETWQDERMCICKDALKGTVMG